MKLSLYVFYSNDNKSDKCSIYDGLKYDGMFIKVYVSCYKSLLSLSLIKPYKKKAY